jgi:hypothetical protein
MLMMPSRLIGDVSQISRAEILCVLTDARLDIAVKYRLFTDADDAALRVYKLHILGRTGGVEPGGDKHTIDEYVAAAWNLQASISSRGFDAALPIRICSYGKLRGGAHRLACGLALGILPWRRLVRGRSMQRPWGAAQLAQAGIRSDDIERAQRDMEKLRNAARDGDWQSCSE